MALGYPDQALKRSHEALTLAQELSHPFSPAFALALLPCSISSAGRGRQPKSGRRRLITLSTEQGFPFWLAIGTILRGWALVEQGQGEEGIAQIHQGWLPTGPRSRVYARIFCPVAEAHGKGGQTEEGLSMLAEALAA